jgi:hypothetical protein
MNVTHSSSAGLSVICFFLDFSMGELRENGPGEVEQAVRTLHVSLA